jgi:hypothetical protein
MMAHPTTRAKDGEDEHGEDDQVDTDDEHGERDWRDDHQLPCKSRRLLAFTLRRQHSAVMIVAG